MKKRKANELISTTSVNRKKGGYVDDNGSLIVDDTRKDNSISLEYILKTPIWRDEIAPFIETMADLAMLRMVSKSFSRLVFPVLLLKHWVNMFHYSPWSTKEFCSLWGPAEGVEGITEEFFETYEEHIKNVDSMEFNKLVFGPRLAYVEKMKLQVDCNVKVPNRLGEFKYLTELIICDCYCDHYHEGGGRVLIKFKPPDSLKKLWIDDTEFIEPESIPITLEDLCLGNVSNTKLLTDKSFLPPSLIGLYVSFSHTLNERWRRSEDLNLLDNLPESLHRLTIRGNFDSHLDNLPQGLEELTIFLHRGDRDTLFNRSLDHLPKSLRKFEFDAPYPFASKLEHLPSSLVHLSIGACFDSEIDHLPPSLKTLKFTHVPSFNKSVDCLPATLTQLKFSAIFNQSVDHLPETLVRLTFSKRSFFNQSVDRLPSSLQYLTLGFMFRQSIDRLPFSLKVLIFAPESYFNQSVDHLPSALKTLLFGGMFDQPVDHLPSSLETLGFGTNFNQSLEHLPPSLKRLSLGGLFNHSLDQIPKGILELEFSLISAFQRKLSNFPPRLQTLVMSKEYHLKLENMPRTLTRIKVSTGYPHVLPNYSPKLELRYSSITTWFLKEDEKYEEDE